ncbi:MAG TPA: cardiolipin synthase [Terriglobales bacterium]|nr:cardiolipin synthase [Terriglobales bacterium]
MVRRRASWLILLILWALVGCAHVPTISSLPDITLGESSFFPTLEGLTDSPIVGGNKVDILLNGDQTFPLMLREIKKAKSTVTFAQYLYKGGSLAHELAQSFAERCRAGVKVLILLDSQGSKDAPEEIPQTLRQAGCHLAYFRRVEAPQLLLPWELLRYNYRNHRRILVIDGKVGFTGGYGISDAWLGDGRTKDHWRDTNVRIEGPAVKYLQAAFSESWLEATGRLIGGEGFFPRLEDRGKKWVQVVKSSPVGGSFQNYLLYLLSITSARKSILITNPYFIPDDRMIEALLDAAKRGVRVVILVPEKIDFKITYRASRKNYGELLQGGVKIFEYTPALLHAKTMVIDGVWATVGSTNLDNRSFALNEELNVVFYDTSLAQSLKDTFEDDLKHAKRITYEEWESRPLTEKFFEIFTWPLEDEL